MTGKSTLRAVKDPAELSTIEVTAFGQHCEYTGVAADDREAWLAKRQTVLSASDVAAVMGEDEHRSALEVWVDKVTPRKGPEIVGPNDPRFWGNVLEQPVLRAMAKWNGWEYRPGGYLLRSRAMPELACTLDAEIDRNDGLGWLVNEGKTTRVPRGWDEDEGQLPLRVLIQTQVQLFVTGAPLCIVFALLQGSRPVTIPIEPSRALHDVFQEYTGWFMDLVKRREAPAPDGSESSKRALARLYPESNGSAVQLPDEAIEWTRTYNELGARMKADERRRDHIKNTLRAHIGPASHGILPEPVDDRSCWRLQKNRGSDTRTLQQLKHSPVGVPLLPGPSPSELEASLEQSLATAKTEHAETAKLKRKRRKARR